MVYQYLNLDPNKKEIRLLQLWSRQRCSKESSAGQLHGSLVTISLFDNPLYQALSYTWGGSGDAESIVIDGEAVKCTKNLEAALGHIQEELESVMLWIDAISINQQDDAEKGWQVAQMGDVYRQAERVVIWLGEEADGSNEVMDAIALIGKQGSNFVGKRTEELELMADKCATSISAKADTYPEDSPELLYHRIIGTFGNTWQFPLRALTALIRRPWWRRVWVLQELVLARGAVFLCGAKKVDERDVMGAFAAIDLIQRTTSLKVFDKQETPSEYEKNFISAIVDNAAAKMLMYRRRLSPLYEGSASLSLHSLLRLTAMGRTARKEANFNVTDPRDRVFGLLGLANDNALLDIRPNYIQDCCEAYTSAAISLLEHGCISILDLNQTPKVVADLPSWVPDWSVPLMDPLLLFEDGWYSAKEPSFRASGSTSPSIKFLAPNGMGRVLSISGLRLDAIKHIGKTWQEYWPEEDEEAGNDVLEQGFFWLEKLYAMCSHRRFSSLFKRKVNGPMYGSDEEWRLGMLRVSTGGQITDAKGKQPRKMTKGDSLELIKYISSPPEDGNDMQKVWEYMMNISERSYRKKPFLTSNRFLGLGPAEARRGDIVVIFKGAAVPYVIRPAEEPSYFHFLGDAYVEGVMEGEAVSNGVVFEEFQLL